MSEDDNLMINAASEGNVELLQELLQNFDIDVNFKNNDGYTALMIACTNNYIDMVKVLLNIQGIDVNIRTKYGYSALMIACKFGYVNIVELLLLKGININVSLNDKKGNNALMVTCSSTFYKEVDETKRERIVNLLFSIKGHDINIDSVNFIGNTVLIFASSLGLVNIVSLIFQRYPHVECSIKNKRGNTALMMALKNSYANVVKVLLENCIYVDKDLKIIKKLAFESMDKKICHLISEKEFDMGGINIESVTRDKDGFNYFMECIYNKDFDKTKENLKKLKRIYRDEIDLYKFLNQRDYNGRTAFMMASYNNDENIVDLLLSIPQINTDLIDIEEFDAYTLTTSGKIKDMIKDRVYTLRKYVDDKKEIGCNKKNVVWRETDIKTDGNCFDLVQFENYDIKNYLEADDIEDEEQREMEKKKRIILFVGEDISNVKPYCSNIDNLTKMADDTMFYTTRCDIWENGYYAYRNPLVSLRFEFIVYLYLNDLIEILKNGKHMFVILPCGTKTIKRTASLDTIKRMDSVSGDHCNEGTEKRVYDIYEVDDQFRTKIPISFPEEEKSVNRCLIS